MTLIEYLARTLNAPENQVGVKRSGRICGGLFDAFNEFCTEIETQTAKLQPSPGYEPWLIRHRTNPTVARLMARVLVRRGKRIATEEKQLREIVDALRFLATSRTSRPAVFRRVKILLNAWDQTCLLQELLEKRNINASEFVGLLRAYESNDTEAANRLTRATAQIHFSLRRGPKIGMASAAHEAFIEFAVKVVEPRIYTWSDVEEDYTDPITEATRCEFGSRRFNPQSACRRLKRRAVPA